MYNNTKHNRELDDCFDKQNNYLKIAESITVGNFWRGN